MGLFDCPSQSGPQALDKSLHRSIKVRITEAEEVQPCIVRVLDRATSADKEEADRERPGQASGVCAERLEDSEGSGKSVETIRKEALWEPEGLVCRRPGSRGHEGRPGQAGKKKGGRVAQEGQGQHTSDSLE